MSDTVHAVFRSKPMLESTQQIMAKIDAHDLEVTVRPVAAGVRDPQGGMR